MHSISELIVYLQNDNALSFKPALSFFDDSKFSTSVKEYKDEEGNHVIHYAIQALARKLADLYKPFESKKSVSSHLLPDADAKSCIDSCFDLVNRMCEVGISPEPNNIGHKPLDLLNTASISAYCDKKEIFQKYLPLLERNGPLYAGRKYISDLSFFRNSKKEWKICAIPDAFPMLDKYDCAKLTLHERLALSERNIRKGSTGGAINLVVANLGFVISDLPKSDPGHKPVFVTIPICIDNYQCFAEGGLFQGTHSEAALCYVLKNETYLRNLLTDLKAFHPYVLGQKAYSVVLDLHSTAEVCRSCQRRLHGLQADYDENSFLKKLESLLSTEGYILPRKSYVDKQENSLYPKLRLTIRASGMDDPGSYGDDSNDIMPAVFNERPPLDIKCHPQKTLFHLPPSWNKYIQTSHFASFDDREKIKSYKTQHRAFLCQAFPERALRDRTLLDEKEKEQSKQAKTELTESIKIAFLTRFPKRKFLLYCQTAFSNTGGVAKSVDSDKIKQFKSLDIDAQEMDDIFYGLSV